MRSIRPNPFFIAAMNAESANTTFSNPCSAPQPKTQAHRSSASHSYKSLMYSQFLCCLSPTIFLIFINTINAHAGFSTGDCNIIVTAASLCGAIELIVHLAFVAGLAAYRARIVAFSLVLRYIVVLIIFINDKAYSGNDTLLQLFLSATWAAAVQDFLIMCVAAKLQLRYGEEADPERRGLFARCVDMISYQRR
ncbi:hypothetical protein K432DRAFT_406843 [Lepidopterella palustris CBS 459.81]|uniref:Transmembrane protein n=1 Tax=Lepidopterella palustris CBS 459.81 TaxID=1314670 RepID=A0A8E2E5X8_9PEZI|nr:hypothetical protein K432DRAFT_406843 [Lepidopterella palustris CBS 459.81]